MSGPKKRGAASGGARGQGRNSSRAAGAKSGRSGAPGRGRGGAPRSGSAGAGPASGGSGAQRGDRSRTNRKAPEQRGLGGTQVEGRHAVRELLLAGTRKAKEILIAEGMDRADILDDIVELAQDLRVPVREVSKKKLDGVSRTEASQGVVAVADPIKERPLEELCETQNGMAPFLVAVDGVTDPGNLGAIIRTAECAGVSGMVLPKHRAVHVTPTVTKAAAGAVEHVPMALVGGLPRAIEEMQRAGVWVLGLDMGGDVSIHEVALGAEPVCLVMGAEGAGLSRLVRERCDQVVSIPLAGQLSSLNVSTAAALAIYEVVRRRGSEARAEGPAGAAGGR